MAPLWFMLIWLFIFLQSSVKLIDAVTAVSFQFLTTYTSVQSSVDEFTSQLVVDLRTKYSFTSQQITSVQVFPSPSDRIQVDFDLDIDTRNSMLISQRETLKEDLLAPNYIFLFTNATGAREAFVVDSDSASVIPSFRDGWHQYAPDILYAVLVGLVLFALFSSAVYCLVTKQKERKRHSSDSVNGVSTGHSNGIDNDGYVSEMTQVYRIKNTEASPIPHRPSIETSLSIIVPSSPETTEPQSPNVLQPPDTPVPVHHHQPIESQLPSLDETPQPSPLMQLQTCQTPDRLANRRSVTTSESPTLNTFMPPPSPSLVRKIVSIVSYPSPRSSVSKPPPSSLRRSQQLDRSPLRISPSTSPINYSEKPPPSPKIVQKATSLQESVRSLPSLLGVSTSTTPTSSRRTSIIGPSIYARLLYSSYSVPPKRIYSYI